MPNSTNSSFQLYRVDQIHNLSLAYPCLVQLFFHEDLPQPATLGLAQLPAETSYPSRRAHISVPSDGGFGPKTPGDRDIGWRISMTHPGVFPMFWGTSSDRSFGHERPRNHDGWRCPAKHLSRRSRAPQVFRFIRVTRILKTIQFVRILRFFMALRCGV